MKVVGLCKALTCGDFIPAVLSGIYDALDGIVFIYSQRDWSGHLINNEVCGPVNNWKQMNDYALKIGHIYTTEIEQNAQYKHGINYIINTYHPDWIFLFDTDEVWEPYVMSLLMEHTENLINENAVFCGMHTYIKSPLYRISPPEPCCPCIMVRALPHVFRGIRGNAVRPSSVIRDIKLHHYSYVRKTIEDVIDKAMLSTKADGRETVNMSQWVEEKWNALPNITNFHTSRGSEGCWQSVNVIDEDEVPRAVRDLPIYKQLTGGSV